MKWNNWIPVWVVGFFAALIGMTYLASDVVHAQSTIPIGRYEFPQDGVVCYRTGTVSSSWPIALSCVKK